MSRLLSAAEAAALPDDVLVSAEAVSRALPPPMKTLPRWVLRVLPKSGLAGTGGGAQTADDLMMDDDENEDEVDDEFVEEETAALHELSFQLRRGEGLGIVGEDRNAISTIVRILIGGLPPTTGRVLVRGLVAPITNRELRRLIGSSTDERKAVKVVARYFHWPLPLIDARWAEIEEFAALHELDQVPAGLQRLRKGSLRLAIAAALHMDANVYVIDPSLHDDPDFELRCLDRVASAKAQGAGVIQSGGKQVEGVARFADQMIWIKDGAALYRGLPVEVAAQVHRNRVEKIESHIVPVTAKLLNGSPVQLGSGGSHVDFELHVLRKDLELGFGLVLANGHGSVFELTKPERLQAPEPGVYRLGITVPPNLLDQASYRASLRAEIAVVGHEPAPPRELLAFDLHVEGDAADDDDLPAGFVLLPVADVELDESDSATWDVSRIGS